MTGLLVYSVQVFLPFLKRETTFETSYFSGKSYPSKSGSTPEGNSLILQAQIFAFNPTALMKIKTAYSFGLSEYNRVKS